MDSIKLGDRHNFGRFVELANGSIVKPRSLYWDYNIVDPQGFIRKSLEKKLAERTININFFENFSKVNFEIISSIHYTGKTTFLNSSPAKDCVNNNITNYDDFIKLGSFIGFSTILGIGDLHKDNIIWLFDKKKSKLFFTPIDIESILNNYELPSQTFLISGKNISKEKSALGWLQSASSDEKLMKVCSSLIIGHIEFIDYITLNASKLESIILQNLFKEKGSARSRSRVITRDTEDYYNYLKGRSNDCFPEEIKQLNNNDIPYFFRIYPSNNIYFFRDEELTDYEQIGPEMSDFIHRNNTTIRDFKSLNAERTNQIKLFGAIQIFRMFIFNSHTDYQYSFKDYEVFLNHKQLTIKKDKQVVLAYKQ